MQFKKQNESYNLKLSTKLNDCEEEEEAEIPQIFHQHLHLPFFDTQRNSRCIKAYIDEPIKDAKYYRPLLHTIFSLSENDIVHLSINSYGGLLDGAIAIINTIENTEATVIVSVDGVAASAASLIALSAPNIKVSEYATMMIHAATFGSFGKQSDVMSHASFVDKKVKSLMQKIYKNFLTDSEFNEVLMGREIWLDADQIIYRLKKREELYSKKLNSKRKSKK